MQEVSKKPAAPYRGFPKLGCTFKEDVAVRYFEGLGFRDSGLVFPKTKGSIWSVPIIGISVFGCTGLPQIRETIMWLAFKILLPEQTRGSLMMCFVAPWLPEYG